MDKTKEIFNNSLQTIQTIKDTSIDIKNIKMKIFDNIIWVIILTIVFFILIMFYLSNQSFNIQYKFDSLDKDYKNILKLSNIDTKSKFENTEYFDEIDINKHTLKEVYISSSSKSYLIGRQILDYCSKEMIMKCLELGARFIEIDIYLGSNNNIVICNGLVKGNWKLTLNTVLFKDFIKILSDSIFDSNTYFNYNDPIILLLNVNLPKTKLNELYNILYNNLKSFLPNKKYNLRNGNNILDAKIKELLQKIIIITNGPIGNSKMMDIVHLRIGDRVRLISFKELYSQKEEYNINFNKNHLTIVKPEIGIRSLNYSPDRAWDYGCQIVALHFQVEDDFMKEYINKFRNKSYLLKPYEFTKFIDKPQKGYDKNKISYYPTYKDEELKFIVPTKILTNKCCKTITDFDEYLPSLQIVNINNINLMGKYTKNANAANSKLYYKHLNEHITIISQLPTTDGIEIIEFYLLNIYGEPTLKNNIIKGAEDYDTLITKNNVIGKKTESFYLKTQAAEKTVYKKYFNSFETDYVAFDSGTNSFLNTTRTYSIRLGKSFIEIYDISASSSDTKVILKAYTKDGKNKLDKTWENLNNYNWFEDDDNIFTDQLYFYSHNSKNYVISLNYIYIILILNANIITIDINNKKLGNLNKINTESPIDYFDIKYDNNMINNGPKLNENYINDLNKNIFNVYVGKKKIFNLNIHFSFNTSTKTLFIEYKNKNLNLNKLRNKLKSFKIQEHKDIRKIQNISNSPELLFYINRHIYNTSIKQLFSNNYYNKYDLIYYILYKQIKMAYEKEKKNEMSFDYENKCKKTNIDSCENERLCYVKEIPKGKSCESQTSNIPFPKLCTPRSIIANRNSCSESPPVAVLSKNLRNKDNRQLLHDMHTKYEIGINGKWYNPNKKTYLDIPNTFSEYCETTFTTPVDDKTYTIRYVYSKGSSVEDIEFTNMINYKKEKEKNESLLARGTFIDNKLREYEKIHNIVPLKIHGYCEIKVYLKPDKSTPESIDEYEKRIEKYIKCKDIHTMEAYYKYDDSVKTILSYLKTLVPITKDKTYILNSYDEKKSGEVLFYRLNDPECNDQLIKEERITTKTNVQQDKIYTKEDLYSEGFIGHLSSKILDFDDIESRINQLKQQKPVKEKKEKKEKEEKKETQEEKKQRELKEVKKDIGNFFFYKKKDEIENLKNLNLTKNQLKNLKLLSSSETIYFNKLNDKEKNDFLNKNQKEREDIVKDSKYYETPISKEKEGLSMDMIQDGQSDDFCLKRRLSFDEGTNCRKRFYSYNKNRPKSETCDIDECMPLNPILTSCTIRGDKDPYCSDNSFGKWGIEKKKRIKLHYDGPEKICELEDIDYNLHKTINKNKLTIEYFMNLKKTLDIDDLPEKPKGLKEEIQKKVKELTIKKTKLEKEREIIIKKQNDIELGKINKKILEISNEIKKEPQKIKDKYKIKIDEDIEKLKKEIIVFEKKIQDRINSGKYTNIINNRCLAHGEIRRPSRNIFFRHIPSKDRRKDEVRLLYCDHKKNYGGRRNMYKKFKFNWKVVKVVNDPPKYIIMTDDNRFCLTKKKLSSGKKKKKEDEDEEEETNFNEGDYLTNFNGKLEGVYELKPCEFDEMDLYEKEPEFDTNTNIDKKTYYVFSPNVVDITVDIEKLILYKLGHTKHINSPNLIQILISNEGLYFLKNNPEFLKTEIGKKFEDTEKGKEIIKLSKKFDKKIILKRDITYRELLNYNPELKEKYKKKYGKGYNFYIDYYTDYDDIDFLYTDKGKEEINKRTPRVIRMLIKDTDYKFLKNNKSWFFFTTSLGIDYLNNYLGKMFIKTEYGEKFLSSSFVKLYIDKFDTMKQQLFRFKNYNNILKCPSDDITDPRNKEIVDKAKKELEDAPSKIKENSKQKTNWQNSVPEDD